MTCYRHNIVTSSVQSSHSLTAVTAPDGIVLTNHGVVYLLNSIILGLVVFLFSNNLF